MSRGEKKCKANSPAELVGEGKRGQNITLNCDKNGKHPIHEDKVVGAKFVKLGKGGDIVWPSKRKR